MIRRLADIFVALVVLLLLTPLFLVVTAAILLSSPGKPFYGGWRSGKDNVKFRMWKFRTMVTGADRMGGAITTSSDSRVTPIGKFLRATKIDELPQFVNLLTGDITLVGPRPEDPNIVERYTPEQMETLRVKPGITGPGQLYYTTDQAATVPEGPEAEEYYIQNLLGPKLQKDIDYLKRQTMWSDCGVVLQTVAVMFGALTKALRGADRAAAVNELNRKTTA
jgi:lipopolysaccharide/colanic/teichoic acid biosynthesis glycosyltransferase